MPVIEQRIKKWGNSQGILLPNDLCEAMSVGAGDYLIIDYSSATQDASLRAKRDYTIDTLLAGYTGPKPSEVYPAGEAVGRELW